MAGPTSKPSSDDIKRFLGTLPKKKGDGPPLRVELPEPVLKWRFKIKRDSKGQIEEVIAEALE